MVMVNTDYDYFTYTPMPDVILPEEGDPYYYYSYSDSDSYDADSSSGYYEDQEGTADDAKNEDDTSTKRRTIRSVEDFKKLTEIRTVKDYWPDYYYSIEAIAVL